VSLWFVTRSKASGKFRDRRGQALFIDARKVGSLVDRIHRELSASDIVRILKTYHAWRGEPDAGTYEDVQGFCKSVTIEAIRQHSHLLTPGRHVGAEEIEDDDEPFQPKIARLVEKLEEHFADSARLEAVIRENL